MPATGHLVTVETQSEFDLLSGDWAERTFVKLYVEARKSGLLAAISDRNWKTLCVLATYMDRNGYCYPSQAELARAIGCSRQMANERIKSLAEFRFHGKAVLMVVPGERGEGGQFPGNRYRVMPISNLRIFDDETNANHTEDTTVSRKLDTAKDAPVSSQTVTVPLDTNKNQDSELDRNNSKFRRVKPSRNKSEGLVVTQEAAPVSPGSEDDQPAIIQEPLRRGHRTPSPDTPESPQSGFSPISHLLAHRAEKLPARGAETLQKGHQETGQHGARIVVPPQIRELVERTTRQFHDDERHLLSNLTRAMNLYHSSELSEYGFCRVLVEAELATQRAGNIKKPAEGESYPGRKNKVPYWWAIVENRLEEFRQAIQDQPPESRE